MANFPTNPAWEDIMLPSPPIKQEGQDVETRLANIEKYLHSVFVSFMELNSAIETGWLIKDARVLSLQASKIVANSIFTNVLYLGSEKKITLDAPNNIITVTDNQPTPQTRVRIGKLGTGNQQYGIEVMDSTGIVRFRASNVTEIDGAILKDATITGAKIVDATLSGVKLVDSAITTNKVSSNAISKTASARVTSVSLTTTEQTLVSLNFTVSSTTSDILVFGTLYVSIAASASGMYTGNAVFNLYRGTTQLDTLQATIPTPASTTSQVPVTFAFYDTGVSGVQTYKIAGRVTSTTNLTSATALFPDIKVVELKR